MQTILKIAVKLFHMQCGLNRFNATKNITTLSHEHQRYSGLSWRCSLRDSPYNHCIAVHEVLFENPVFHHTLEIEKQG